MKMKFPNNIVKDIKNSGKTTVTERLSLIAFLAVFINFILYSQLVGLVVSIGIPKMILFLVQLAITGFISLMAFRIFVIREDDKVKEFENSKDSSLSNYYYLLDKDNVERIETAPIFEYSDGNFMMLIRFSYGHSQYDSSVGTRLLYEFLFNECGKADMEVRTFNMPECFKDSVEYSNIISGMSRIKSPELSTVMRDIISNLLDECDKYVGLMDTTIQIKTKSLYQVRDLGTIVKKLMDKYSNTPNSIRSIEFLGKNKLRSFLRDYYCLEALDLSSLKTVSVDRSTLIKSQGLVQVCELELSSGEIRVKINEESLVKNKARKL